MITLVTLFKKDFVKGLVVYDIQLLKLKLNFSQTRSCLPFMSVIRIRNLKNYKDSLLSC